METNTDHFSLSWEKFQDNVSKSISDLRDNLDFSDVTLVCEDNQQVKAHRVVLSSNSPLLSSILRSLKHPQPLVYLWGVRAGQLEDVMEFCYRGQVNVSTLDIDDFLRVAKMLGVKGLIEGGLQDDKTDLVKPQEELKPLDKQNNFQICDTTNMDDPFAGLDGMEVHDMEIKTRKCEFNEEDEKHEETPGQESSANTKKQYTVPMMKRNKSMENSKIEIEIKQNVASYKILQMDNVTNPPKSRQYACTFPDCGYFGIAAYIVKNHENAKHYKKGKVAVSKTPSQKDAESKLKDVWDTITQASGKM